MTFGVLAQIGGIEPATLAQAVTAVVGFFVAYQAFRGYRRNDSRPMLFLGVGIAFVTTVSFVVSTLVVSPLGYSEGVTILSWVVANVIGLSAIFYAFTGAGRGSRDADGRRPRRDAGDTNARTDPDVGSDRRETDGGLRYQARDGERTGRDDDSGLSPREEGR